MLYFYNMSISDAYDRTFKALGHQVRRQILDDLRDQPLTTGTLCAHFPELDRCTVMQHLKVLEDADLVIPVRKGRERWNHLNWRSDPGDSRTLDRPARGDATRAPGEAQAGVGRLARA